ncbi:MAG: tetratricopeptide repeat protein, partial [Desulfobacterales bacterium]|nr:tetratricopeptide repeat protein [Desulfobacterales bacterium]
VSSNRVLHAINPVAFVRLALSMGKGYLGMFALLTILWGAPALVMKYLAPIMGFRTLQFSTFMISGYYMLVSYHLMGYVTLQYHRKIGYEIDVENFTGETPPPVQSPPSEHQEQKSPHLQRITFLLKEGKMNEALKTLDRIRIEGAGLHHMDLAHKYFELLKMMKKDQEMCEFGREYIESLVKEKNKEKTLEVWTCCIQKEPGFLPSIQALYAIGMWVSDKESPEKGIAIFQRAIKAYPNDPMVPQFWFRSARILNDRLYRREKAMKLLEGIIKKYPDDKIRPQVENYLSTL